MTTRDGTGQRGEPNTGASWAALLLRCVLGVTFVAHGIQKVVVLGWSGGIPNYRSWGIPLAEVTYPLTIVAEVGGGLLLLLGLWVRPSAATLAVVMLVALFTVHLPYGFFLPGGIEFVLVLVAANLALVLLGAGRWGMETWLPTLSVERWITGRWGRS